MPVASFNGGNGGAVIALDARQASGTVAIRPDESALPVAELWKKITPVRPGPGLVLPGRPARLELTASARLRSGGGTLGPMSVTLSIQDAAGIGYSVPAGRLPVDGRRHQLVAMLSVTRQASYPLRLLGISLAYQLPGFPAPPNAPPAAPAAAKRAAAAAAAAARQTAEHLAARRAVLTISGVHRLAVGGRTIQPVRHRARPADLAAGAGSQDLVNPKATGYAPAITGWQAAPGGARTLTFGPGYGHLIQAAGYPPLPVSGQLTLTAAAPRAAAVLPAIATRAFLSSSQAAIGSVLFVAAGPVRVPVRIVAAIREFPTMGTGSALIIDQAAIQELLARKSAAPLPVTAWWLRTTGPVTLTAARLPPDASVTERATVTAAMLDNPLSAAPQQGVLAIAVAAALLAALGFSVSVAASMRERRTQSALLAALGVSRAAQARQLCLEQLMLSVRGRGGGLLLGAGLAHLLIPAVTVTAAAAAPVPPTAVDLPLAWAVGLAVAVTAVPVLAAAATVMRRLTRRPSCAPRRRSDADPSGRPAAGSARRPPPGPAWRPPTVTRPVAGRY